MTSKKHPDINKCKNCIFGKVIDDDLNLVFCRVFRRLSNDVYLSMDDCEANIPKKNIEY